MKNNKKAGKIVAIISALALLFLVAVIILVSSGNPLIGKSVKEYTLRSGGGAEIGKYAVVDVSTKEFEKLTPEYYYEYAKESVENSGFNYYAISSKDGRGAVWNGSDITVLTVGTLDKDYAIEEPQTVYTLSGDTYVKAN